MKLSELHKVKQNKFQGSKTEFTGSKSTQGRKFPVKVLHYDPTSKKYLSKPPVPAKDHIGSGATYGNYGAYIAGRPRLDKYFGGNKR